jgi:hypothetical protein
MIMMMFTVIIIMVVVVIYGGRLDAVSRSAPTEILFTAPPLTASRSQSTNNKYIDGELLQVGAVGGRFGGHTPLPARGGEVQDLNKTKRVIRLTSRNGPGAGAASCCV